VVRRHLKQRYFKWLADVLRELEEKGKAVVMLGDQLLGELSVDKEGYLHWQLLIGRETYEELVKELGCAWANEILDILEAKVLDVE